MTQNKEQRFLPKEEGKLQQMDGELDSVSRNKSLKMCRERSVFDSRNHLNSTIREQAVVWGERLCSCGNCTDLMLASGSGGRCFG